MKRALVVCPGRGSYNAAELGYLARPERAAGRDLVARADELRGEFKLPDLSGLDAAPRLDPALHLPGRHASPLIFTCSAVDARLISDDFEIVAVLGNSMGWYSALHVAGALGFDDAFRLIQTMSLLQDEHSRGGQLLYPLTDEQWRLDSAALSAVDAVLADVNGDGEPCTFWSIRLGGFAVLAGTDEGLEALRNRLPGVKRGGREYPVTLPGHAAYHTPLLEVTSNLAVERFSDLILHPPSMPLIDGRGHIFKPYICDPAELYGYTFVLQVTRPFDFAHAVRVGLREFGPDCIILLGPGDQLGGPIGQVVVSERWQGMSDRAAFSERQRTDPFLLSMGRAEQFSRVAGATATA